ncbi:MAG: hypothetical protein JO060_04825 [Candidatus Eremiobacteraeota bacterium]|nr:hypothetical protein [Candidatus Eremiobacteraeota bacterium]
MQQTYRQRFNAAYSPGLFRRYHADLEQRLGWPVGFRLAETPVFFPTDFRERVLRAAREIIAQLCEPARLEPMREAVPRRWRVPRPTSLPTFVVLDFAAVRCDDGTIVPRLVELQGFPSLLAFESMQADAWEAALQEIPGLEGDWSGRFLEREPFSRLARDVIVGDHDPSDVVLLDLHPGSQKTACDFSATRRLFGVDFIGPEGLRKIGRRLVRRRADGRDVPVRRIYNRMIVDEIERTGTPLPFDMKDDLDVEWTPHPDWFFIWSKHALPFLDHPAVPRTRFLSDVREIPERLEEHYVLKPLFSFAGGGVKVRPTPADIDAIAPQSRGAWCLQERVDYSSVIAAPDGGAAKAEIRIMCLRRERDHAFTPAINLCRLTRGEMVGVDYNRDVPWTGSTIGLCREPTASR